MIFHESLILALRRNSRQSQNSSRVRGCLVLPTWHCSLRISHIRFTRLRQAWWIGKSIPFSASVLSYTDKLSSLPSVVGIAGSRVYWYCHFAGGEMKKSGVEETFLKSGCLICGQWPFVFSGTSLSRFPPSTDYAKVCQPLLARLARFRCTGRWTKYTGRIPR